MEILTITENKTVIIKTVEDKKASGFNVGKIKIATLPALAKKELIKELESKGFCHGMIHTAMNCKLEDLQGYVNVWKYVAYMLAVELMERC